VAEVPSLEATCGNSGFRVVYACESDLSATGLTTAETLSETVSKQTGMYQARQQNNTNLDFHTNHDSNPVFAI